MKRIMTLSWTLLAALSVAPLYAGEPCGCCVEDTCPTERWSFRIERTEMVEKVQVPVNKWFATPSKVVCEQQLACGACTKTTVTDIIPVDKCSTKPQDKIKVCTTIYMECKPVMEIHHVEAPGVAK